MGIENRKVCYDVTNGAGRAGIPDSDSAAQCPGYGSRAAEDGGPGKSPPPCSLVHWIGDGGVDIVGNSESRVGNDLTEGNPLEEAPIAPGMMNAGDLRAEKVEGLRPIPGTSHRPVNRPRARSSVISPSGSRSSRNPVVESRPRSLGTRHALKIGQFSVTGLCLV